MQTRKRDNKKPAAFKAGAETEAIINRRRRRRVLRTVASAVLGGVIAGPIGAAAGAMVGAARRRRPVPRKPAAAGTKAKAEPRKSLTSGKTLATRKPGRRPARKKSFTNIYPPIP